MGVGALIVDNDRIVLVRRRNEPAQGEWSIPGGLVKLGETLERAVVREAREETGLDVEPKILVKLLERIFPDDRGRVRYHYILADYLCSVVGGSLIAGSDATDAVWAGRSELNWYALPDANMQVILSVLDRDSQRNSCHDRDSGAVSDDS
ncbi:MAG: NUDIX hydrolase [Pseudomonadota bacterium]